MILPAFQLSVAVAASLDDAAKRQYTIVRRGAGGHESYDDRAASDGFWVGCVRSGYFVHGDGLVSLQGELGLALGRMEGWRVEIDPGDSLGFKNEVEPQPGHWRHTGHCKNSGWKDHLDRARVREAIGMEFLRLGDVKSAREAFSDATTLAPWWESVHDDLRVACRKLGDTACVRREDRRLRAWDLQAQRIRDAIAR